MLLPDFFEFHLPTRIVFQNGAITLLADEITRLGRKRPYLITDRPLRESGALAKVEAALRGAGMAPAGVYDDIPRDSDVRAVERGAELARASGADCLVALGGGSVMDTAKGMNILLGAGGALLDHQGINVIAGPLWPLLSIPTTAGTGSEVSRFAVIKDTESHSKVTFVSPHLASTVAVLDPELTLSMPPKLTAATGMDALTHAVEGCFSKGATPMTDAIGFLAMRMLSENIVKAVHDGADLAVRGRMVVAATMAGVAFSNAGVCCVHALAHTLGGLYGVPHGIANAILLPLGARFNLPTCRTKLDQFAEALGVSASGDAESKIDRITARLRQLVQDCGIPPKLRDWMVPEDGLAQVASGAMCDGAMFYNPQDAAEEDLLAMVREAW
ncbi:MAG: iron-containing alcohol dehydrogenase [Planctomycetes bacterium]|nr:iron-containing alcohol dehydrogenase [Planctomycetota bacterium]